jgi:hypothetical protein
MRTAPLALAYLDRDPAERPRPGCSLGRVAELRIDAVVSLCRLGTLDVPVVALEDPATFWVIDSPALCESGRHVPLPVNGVPGLILTVVSDRPTGERPPIIARADDRVYTTRVVLTATAPDYGTASFDRLLQAALDAD